MKKIKFDGHHINLKNYIVLNDIDGVLYKNVVVSSSGIEFEHNLNREPNFVFITLLENGVVWVDYKNKKYVRLKSNGTISCDILIL